MTQHIMQIFITIGFLIFISFSSIAQDKMELSCADRIQANSKNKIYGQFKGVISISRDTIKYDSSIIIIHNAHSPVSSAFEQGLIFPELILTTGTSFNASEIKYFPQADTLNISDLEEINLPRNDSTLKTFRFLIWQKGRANPSLYLFELKSEYFYDKDAKQLINRKKLTAFGFCSILI